MAKELTVDEAGPPHTPTPRRATLVSRIHRQVPGSSPAMCIFLWILQQHWLVSGGSQVRSQGGAFSIGPAVARRLSVVLLV